MSETPAAAMFANQRSREDQLIAVIDIGSNSVRLVVYKGLRRNPVVFFNERVICGLGTGLRSGDALAPEPMEMALQTLQRFAHLCKDMKVDQINAIATAAVRNAANKALFVDQIREQCGFDVNVVSGEEEARYSALGVVAGFPGADGVVGDMGGGSLELVNLVDGAPQEKVSLPIGPLSLADGPTKAEASHREIVAKALAGVDWLGNGKGRPFYMVGGAWRALARLHMDATDYALTVHHSYRLAAAELAAFAHRISDQSPRSLPRARTIAAGRFDVIPLAAMILELSLIAKIFSTPILGTRSSAPLLCVSHKFAKSILSAAANFCLWNLLLPKYSCNDGNNSATRPSSAKIKSRCRVVGFLARNIP